MKKPNSTITPTVLIAVSLISVLGILWGLALIVNFSDVPPIMTDAHHDAMRRKFREFIVGDPKTVRAVFIDYDHDLRIFKYHYPKGVTDSLVFRRLLDTFEQDGWWIGSASDNRIHARKRGMQEAKVYIIPQLNLVLFGWLQSDSGQEYVACAEPFWNRFEKSYKELAKF